VIISIKIVKKVTVNNFFMAQHAFLQERIATGCDCERLYNNMAYCNAFDRIRVGLACFESCIGHIPPIIEFCVTIVSVCHDQGEET
jgi:hypothetical protein